MDANGWKILFQIVLSLFLFYNLALYLFTSNIIPILIDKSFGDKKDINSKSNTRKAIMKTWFFLLFLFSYLFSISNIKSYNQEDDFVAYAIYINSFFFVLGIILMLLFHLFPIKLAKKEYYQNIETKEPYEKKLNDLNASTVKEEDLILNEFNVALKKNYFVCELSQFIDLLRLNEPTEKIVWNPVIHTKLKDRQLFLTFLNKLFQNQMVKISRKEVCLFVNKYFEFNEIGHKKENPLNPDNIYDWIKKI